MKLFLAFLGVFNKSIFFRLDRICEDCYSLFREVELHSLCKWVSSSIPLVKPYQIRLLRVFCVSPIASLSRFTSTSMACITQRISDYLRLVYLLRCCAWLCDWGSARREILGGDSPSSMLPSTPDVNYFNFLSNTILKISQLYFIPSYDGVFVRKVDFRSHWPMKFVISFDCTNLRTDLIFLSFANACSLAKG